MIAAELLTPPRSLDAAALSAPAAPPAEAGPGFAQVLADCIGGTEACAVRAPVVDPEILSHPPVPADEAALPVKAIAPEAIAPPQAASAEIIAQRVGQPPAPGQPQPPGQSMTQTQPKAEPATDATDMAEVRAAPPEGTSDTAEVTAPRPPAAPTEAKAEGPADPAPTTEETAPPAQPDESMAETAEAATDPAAEVTPATALPAQAVPLALPPLAALIQPILASEPAVAPADPEQAPQAEPSGSKPRQRPMAGRLAEPHPATGTPAPAATTSDAPQPFAGTAEPESGRDAPLTPPADPRAVTAAATQPQAQTLPAATPRADALPLDTARPGWEAALSERITARMTDIGQEIDITLSPEKLGTLHIRLELSDSTAQVRIVTETPQAAQLFQQSEHRLSEALNRSGLTLASHDATSRDMTGRDGGGKDTSPRGGSARSDTLPGVPGPMQALGAPLAGRHAINLVNLVA